MQNMQTSRNITVAKFGGTSLGTAFGFERSRSWIKSSRNTGIVVASAPGKASFANRAQQYDNVKVTDRLIAIRDAGMPMSEKIELEIGAVQKRFANIEKGLGVVRGVSQLVEQEIIRRMGMNDDSLVALGEFLNARLMVNYLNETGVPAVFVDPKEIGFNVQRNGSSYSISSSLYGKIESAVMGIARREGKILVVPGFYGYDADGALRTFSRGGSDYTATVIAAAIRGAHLNCTDTDGIRMVEPEVSDRAVRVADMTNSELHELTRGGKFGVFQHEAVQPLLDRNISTRVVNTFDTDSEGTLVTATLQNGGRHAVAGIVTRGEGSIALVGEHIGNALVEHAADILRNAGGAVQKVTSNGISHTIEIANLQPKYAAREIYLNLIPQ